MGVTLEEAYRSAEAHHRPLRIAKERTLQASNTRWEMTGAHLPQVVVESTAAYNGFEVAIPDEITTPSYVFVTESGEFVEIPDDVDLPALDSTVELPPLVRRENLSLSISVSATFSSNFPP